jgi:hypothetical protein
VVAALTVVVFAPSCGGSSQTYSVEETKAAFARHGYVLVTPHSFGSGSLGREPEAVLAPRNGSSFIVVVTTDSEADEAWPDFERLQDDDSFDARRANVGVFSDDGPSTRDRRRVLAALNALPDRGSPVLVAGS